MYIGTLGCMYESWSKSGIFYPQSVETSKDKLRYYSTKFDMITMDESEDTMQRPYVIHEEVTKRYTEWLEAVSNNPKFKFVILAPTNFTSSSSILKSIKAWNKFWEGEKNQGGCNILYNSGKLGTVVLQFPSSFGYSERHLNKILKITKQIPTDLRLTFEFLHWSWRENYDTLVQGKSSLYEVFVAKKWCISTPFVENNLVEPGWAGTLRSTRTSDVLDGGNKEGSRKSKGPKILITTDFIYLSLNGTLGPHLGSYDDDNHFLERLSKLLIKLKHERRVDVFCSFDAFASKSLCYPLPDMNLSGFYLNPKLVELPGSARGVDRPCLLHDALRMKELVTDDKNELDFSEYQRDGEGYLVLEFCT